MAERCTCTAAGEDPHCPHHGYEAVIRRYERALVDIQDYADGHLLYEEADWISRIIREAYTSPPHAQDATQLGRER